MALIDDIKVVLRISNTAFDGELNDLISVARHDLMLSGVTSEKANLDTDALIKRAVTTYVKANFGWDNPDAEKLNRSYDLLKNHLSLSKEYNSFTITFTVTSDGVALEDVIVTFNGDEKFTNSLGVAKFTGVETNQNMEYKLSKIGYRDHEGKVDVEKSETISVSMVVA